MSMRTPQRGYTLLEMIVSLGIFSMVMLVVTGAYLTLIKLDREARGTSQLVANLSFAVESMGRGIRTGTEYACNGTAGANCPSGGTSFSYRDGISGQTITYRKKTDGSIGQCTGGCSDATAVPLTDPRIRIDAMTFYVRGVGVGDGTQPQVTFVIKGSMETNEGVWTNFSIQTGATQRLIEL